MTARYDTDRQLSAWLHDVAVTREPEHLLDTVLARTARTRRRPAWRIPERWFSMSAITTRLTPAPQVPWRLIALALTVTALLVAGLVIYAGSSRPAPPFGPAANGPLYFSDLGDIYAQAGPDGKRTLIVGGTELDTDPVLSPDGTRVSILRHGEGQTASVWFADPDGSGLRQLDLGGRTPSWFEWLPDARTAISTSDEQRSALMVASIDGPPRVYDLKVAITDAFPRPGHASQIAFLGTASNRERGIYIVNTDGTGLTRLELDPGFQADPAYSLDKDFYFWEHRWSPAGDRLLYTTLEPLNGELDGAGFRIHLATIDANGAVISDELLEFDPATDDEFQPTWLPSGDGLIFESVESGQHWLSTVSLTASGHGVPKRLEGIQRGDWLHSQLSPDGRFLLVRLPQIVQVDLATGDQVPANIGNDVSWQRLAP